MRTLYLECNMGAAGDMLMAALLELHPQPQKFIAEMNGLGLPDVRLTAERVKKCGIGGTHVEVTVRGSVEGSEAVGGHTHSSHHSHTGLQEIERLISDLPLPVPVRENAREVYHRIAEAEAYVHQQEISQIHFHEVGTLDAVADVVGVCLLLYELRIERVLASSVHVGSGQVRCAHGILPVPAPATAYLLQGIPIYGGAVKGELCTPTGAALLKHFVESFGEMPVMRVEQIGYGMGKKDFAQANCVRALLGETDNAGDQISELVCNLDDMTPEEVGFVTGLLMQEGALDVYTTSIQMKKNRPGVMLTCMCRTDQKEHFLQLIFRHTTTLGIREYVCRRYKLTRREREVHTPYGSVRVKAAGGYGVEREKAEYEDLARIAREQGRSLREVREELEKDFYCHEPGRENPNQY